MVTQQKERTNDFVKIILLFCFLCVRTSSPEGRKCALKEYSLVLCPARPKNQRNVEKKNFVKKKAWPFSCYRLFFFSFLKKANEANQVLLVQRLEHLPSKLIIQVRVL